MSHLSRSSSGEAVEALIEKRRMVCVYVGLKALEQDVNRTGLPYALSGNKRDKRNRERESHSISFLSFLHSATGAGIEGAADDVRLECAGNNVDDRELGETRSM